MDELEAIEATARFLDEFAGAGQGRRVLARLLDDGEDPYFLARDIGKGEAFETLYKESRTLGIGATGPKPPDPALVGLPGLDLAAPFPTLFARDLAPRLGRREAGFGAIFAALAGRERPLVVETGCLRIPGNWSGDGQSSFLFDLFAAASAATFLSIDITPESVESARRVCSSRANFVLNDSVAALHALSGLSARRIDLLYLDSFDLDLADPMPSALHHAMELAAARPLLGPGSIVCVDDCSVPGAAFGKGHVVDMFMAATGALVLHDGYQKAWQLT